MRVLEGLQQLNFPLLDHVDILRLISLNKQVGAQVLYDLMKAIADRYHQIER